MGHFFLAYFIYNSMCILISNTIFIFLPPAAIPFSTHVFALYVCESTSYFVNKFIVHGTTDWFIIRKGV